MATHVVTKMIYAVMSIIDNILSKVIRVTMTRIVMSRINDVSSSMAKVSTTMVSSSSDISTEVTKV